MSEDSDHDTLGNAFRILLEMKMISAAGFMVIEWANLVLLCEKNEQHPNATDEQQMQCSKDWAYFTRRLDSWFKIAQIDLDGAEVVSRFAETSTAEFLEFLKARFAEKSKR